MGLRVSLVMANVDHYCDGTVTTLFRSTVPASFWFARNEPDANERCAREMLPWARVPSDWFIVPSNLSAKIHESEWTLLKADGLQPVYHAERRGNFFQT